MNRRVAASLRRVIQPHATRRNGRSRIGCMTAPNARSGSRHARPSAFAGRPGITRSAMAPSERSDRSRRRAPARVHDEARQEHHNVASPSAGGDEVNRSRRQLMVGMVSFGVRLPAWAAACCDTDHMALPLRRSTSPPGGGQSRRRESGVFGERRQTPHLWRCTDHMNGWAHLLLFAKQLGARDVHEGHPGGPRARRRPCPRGAGSVPGARFRAPSASSVPTARHEQDHQTDGPVNRGRDASSGTGSLHGPAQR